MLTTGQRRHAMRLAYANGGLWALGNGLISTTLIIYLAREYGAKGLVISLIIAAPKLVGTLRLGTPSLIAAMRDRKRFCLLTFFLSYLTLIALPFISAPGVLPSRTASLTAVVILWCVYHLLEYFGVVALWSWLGDLTPRRIRGRFIGIRERWLTVGRIAGMLFASAFAYFWNKYPFWSGNEILNWAEYKWISLVVLAVAGCFCMVMSLLPLLNMQAAESKDHIAVSSWLNKLAAPFFDRKFIRFLIYGIWFAFFNGITQTAQWFYVTNVLSFQISWVLVFQMVTCTGQSGSAPLTGRLIDRIGNRPVMIGSQILVAVALLFFYVATPQQPWWIAGAWVLWIGYVGLNIALPNLMLKLSPGTDTSPSVSAYYAVTGLFFALSTIAGGMLFDYFDKDRGDWLLSVIGMDHYHFLFLVGFAARLLGVVWLLMIIEPSAQSLRQMLFNRKAP